MISLARTVCCPHWMEVMWGEWDSLSPGIWVWEMFGCALKKKRSPVKYLSTCPHPFQNAVQCRVSVHSACMQKMGLFDVHVYRLNSSWHGSTAIQFCLQLVNKCLWWDHLIPVAFCSTGGVYKSLEVHIWHIWVVHCHIYFRLCIHSPSAVSTFKFYPNGVHSTVAPWYQCMYIQLQ